MRTGVRRTGLMLGSRLVCLISTYTGADPQWTFRVAAVVDAGPVTILMTSAIATWGRQPAADLPAWAEWTILALPPAIAAATMIWAHRPTAREDRAGRTPVAWCARCDTAPYADHAGRHYSAPGGYLCPPEQRQPGERRHQPGRTAN